MINTANTKYVHLVLPTACANDPPPKTKLITIFLCKAYTQTHIYKGNKMNRSACPWNETNTKKKKLVSRKKRQI